LKSFDVSYYASRAVAGLWPNMKPCRCGSFRGAVTQPRSDAERNLRNTHTVADGRARGVHHLVGNV